MKDSAVFVLSTHYLLRGSPKCLCCLVQPPRSDTVFIVVLRQHIFTNRINKHLKQDVYLLMFKVEVKYLAATNYHSQTLVAAGWEAADWSVRIVSGTDWVLGGGDGSNWNLALKIKCQWRLRLVHLWHVSFSRSLTHRQTRTHADNFAIKGRKKASENQSRSFVIWSVAHTIAQRFPLPPRCCWRIKRNSININSNIHNLCLFFSPGCCSQLRQPAQLCNPLRERKLFLVYWFPVLLSQVFFLSFSWQQDENLFFSSCYIFFIYIYI